MYEIKQLGSINTKLRIPADKSISHRAVMISSIAKGITSIKPFLISDDTLATIDCIQKLGGKVKLKDDNSVIIEGKGLYFPKKRKVSLYANESGTTLRILSGILCSQKFPVEFKAAPLLAKRPMGRIIEPLGKMGANISGKISKADFVDKKPVIYPPLHIVPSDKIYGRSFNLPIASAQVKSAIMFASLYADRETHISEPYQSRDHTERMLKLFKAGLQIKYKEIICKPDTELVSPGKLFIPSDFSSAAFFIVLGVILKNSETLIKDVNINPTRCGLLRVLRRMGAKIDIVNETGAYEPYGDIRIRSSQLKATTVLPNEIPSMIDEVPILCVAASFAQGTTNIYGVNELKVKETNRLASMLSNLKATGVNIKIDTHATNSIISITGTQQIKPAHFKSFNDHRTAMSAIILGMILGNCSIDNTQCINKSFPGFVSLIKSL